MVRRAALAALWLSACATNPCPPSAPLYCAKADKCCASDTPYHCGDTCWAHASSCSGGAETCTGDSSSAGTGPQQCANLGSGQLYCQSSEIPPTLQGVPGGCCVVVDGTTGNVISASTGYLCAFGSDKTPQGCYDTRRTRACGVPPRPASCAAPTW